MSDWLRRQIDLVEEKTKDWPQWKNDAIHVIFKHYDGIPDGTHESMVKKQNEDTND